uniref:Uncharacterized protein n=1 Tax=Oryza glumipatula TaxID=40148 RepID=A0A0D9Z3A7_9ORYZ
MPPSCCKWVSREWIGSDRHGCLDSAACGCSFCVGGRHEMMDSDNLSLTMPPATPVKQER